MRAKSIKSLFKVLLISMFLGILGSCNNDSDYKENVVISSAEVTEEFEVIQKDKSFQVDKSIPPKDLKIIKSGTARYKVENVKNATNKIKFLAYEFGAYISDLRYENNQYKKENRFTIKVPAKDFDVFLDSVGVVAEFIDYENITTKDVTEEYLDLQTRLKTKQEVRARYEDILRKNAKTVEEILNTEDKLGVIQEEIESAQGRLNYLSSKVSYSSLQIDLYETVDYKEEPIAYKKTFWDKTKEGFVSGWSFLETLIIGMFYIWPFLIIGFVVFLLVKKKGFKK